MLTNNEFLTAVFGEDAPFAHVTGFRFDPGAIPDDQHLIAWRGDWASRYSLQPDTNQYFCISIFNPDEKGIARRRKALFLRTRCIVLDDVREKLPLDQVQRLPPPSWILETSRGSEQWGYILAEPCHERHRVENLLDGLVAQGLAPDGRDPGMKGVTRYVRLPGGINNKASRLIDGQPWKCRMLLWEPSHKVTLEALAAPFAVDLDAQRREGRVDGAAAVPDHPILQVPDIIHIKEVRSDGRFDITCPWVDEHTGGIDNGAAVFTNDDGSLGFKCHHGACEHRTTRDLIRRVDALVPGWGEAFAMWRTVREFKGIVEQPQQQVPAPPPPSIEQPMVGAQGEGAAEEITFASMISDLARMIPGSTKQRDTADLLLRQIDDLPSEIDKIHHHKAICDAMGWTKTEFKSVIKALRDQWARDAKDRQELTFYNRYLYVGSVDKFYDTLTGNFMSVTGFGNALCHKDPDVTKEALMGRCEKVDQVDFAPGMPLVFTEGGVVYGNLWIAGRARLGVQGDASPWLNHFDVIGWSEHKEHILKWMAYTLLHPERKINHMLILGGYEGSGKDFLITPLIRAMENAYGRVIHGDTLLSNFNDYLIATKLLVVNETDTADKTAGDSIANTLKPLAAAPPNTLQVNQKNVTPFPVRNIVNVILTTNSTLPIKLKGTSRRMYACWSDLVIRDDSGDVTQEWRDYWAWMWDWMNNGGWEYCVWYLRNCVDVSQFNPGEPPEVTNFQRDMQDASKSPGVQTIEALVRNRVAAFSIDLISSQDAAAVIKAAPMTGHDAHVYVDPSTVSPARVQRWLRDAGCHSVNVTTDDGVVKLWSLRNHHQYRNMSADQVGLVYENQKSVAETGKPLLQCV